MDATTDLITDAAAAADAAASAAGVSMRTLHRVEEFASVVGLLERIWSSDPTRVPVNVETLRAVSKAGSYVGGAYDGDELVGACFGFFGPPERHSMHSHIAGVSAGMRGRSVGFAIKTHQRAWAVERGLQEISWTFDPLISRNAYFNLVKLGARPAEYHRNFYGMMQDAVNGRDDTDRLLVSWSLQDPLVADAARGQARPAPDPAGTVLLGPDASGAPRIHDTDAGVVRVQVPRDIEAIRQSDPSLASAWRLALRETLGDLLDAGATVTGFDRGGAYTIDRSAPTATDRGEQQ